jgi:hypothetical protein
VDPVPDPLLLRKSGSTGNRTRTSGSEARNSDHQTTETSPILQLVKKITVNCPPLSPVYFSSASSCLLSCMENTVMSEREAKKHCMEMYK